MFVGRSVAPSRPPEEDIHIPRSPTQSAIEDQIRHAHPDEPFIPYVPSHPGTHAPSEGRVPPSGYAPSEGRVPPRERTRYAPSEGRYPPEVPIITEERRPASPAGTGMTHVPPPRPPTHHDFPVQERFEELERSIDAAAREAEDERQQRFLEEEEARNRLFIDNEGRREQETVDRRDALLSDLEQRFARRAPSVRTTPSVLHVPPPVERPAEGPEGEHIPEEEGTQSEIETLQSAHAEAASRHAAEIQEAMAMERQTFLETLQQEREIHATQLREAIEREREEFRKVQEEERERLRIEAEEDRARFGEDREMRVRELEEELARVRAELEEEKGRRIQDDVETREREREAMQERDLDFRNQLVDITNIVQEQRDEMAKKKEMMEERWAEKDVRRTEKDQKLDELRDLVQQLVEERTSERIRLEEERAAGKPSKFVPVFPFPLTDTYISYRGCHGGAGPPERGATESMVESHEWSVSVIFVAL